MAHRPSSRRTAGGGSAEPDLQIGDFVRGKEIGKGSFATVYLATHRKHRAYAAVKAVAQAKLNKKLKENLDAEIRILRALQHPHIVALFSCTETPSYIYLVMEYCQLADLAQFMKKREQLVTLPETADIFKKYPNTAFGLNEVLVRHFVKQIASALKFLRDRNLVHRDIKPQNLLLNPSPSFMARQKPEDVPLAASEHSLVPAVGVETLPMLKIADFGFARHLPQTMMAETLCGSPLYMAPEILSYQKYDAKADLWSVGTVTYEMMVGKPPFRAANHIELLKKIDDAKDRIPFPQGLQITPELHRLIRHLLKRQPTERISFVNYFDSPPVIDPIPGLVGEDRPRSLTSAMPDPEISELSRRMQKQTLDSLANEASSRVPASEQEATSLPPEDVSPMSQVPQTTQFPQSRPTPVVRKTSLGASRPVDIKRPSRADDARPPLVQHATAPARDLLMGHQYSARNPTHIRRTNSKDEIIPSTSVPRQPVAVPSSRADEPSRLTQEQRDQEGTAHEIAFEKEYVVVEKRAVEVNAFADELAASPHIYSKSRPGATMYRRATAPGQPKAGSAAPSSSPSTAMQLAGQRRSDASHNRQPSFDRRFAPNPTSATNMLSKALNMANARLFGVSGSPPLGPGISPPRGYAGFPNYPTPSVGLAISTGKDEGQAGQDEDTRILYIVEDAATRSDTVYSFAEVKYRQLLPATPSAEEGPRIRQIGALEKPNALQGSADGMNDEDQELTQLAVVAVSEEALVLFVKALSILAKSIDLASQWWAQHRRYSQSPPSDAPRPSSPDVSRRMNNVVQWMRNRFNECLEKSEIVGRRLVEAQKLLPEDHPSHPSNHPQQGTASGSATRSSKLGSSGNSSGSLGAGAEQIQLTSGVTAEKLMFERAVEMNRAAAVNELVGEDLRGCEISYRTAMILLQAVLEQDDESLLQRQDKEGQNPDGAISGLDGEERRTVLQLIESTRHRLRSLVKKLQAQAAAEREMRRQSSTGVPTLGSLAAGSSAATARLRTGGMAGSPLLGQTPPR